MLRSGSIATVILLATLAAFGPLSTDMYLPSLPSMTEALATDVARVQMTLSVFYWGFASAQLIYGPLSDRFGRRPILLGGLVLYLIGSVLCAFAPTIELLIAARFVQAMGASAGPVLGRAIVRDLFERNEGAKIMAYMASAMALAPMVAPIFGGQLHALFGWRSNFVALAGFAVLIVLLSWWAVQETNQHKDPGALRPARLFGNARTILGNRRFLGYLMVAACAFGALFSFISGSSFVIIGVLGVSPQMFGFSFMAVVAGYVAGTFTVGKMTGRLGIDRIIGIGAVGVAVSGVILAALPWAGIETIWTLIVPMSFAFAFVGFVLPSAMAGAIAPFPTMAGAASALLGFFQLGSGAFVGVAVGEFFDGTARPMTSAIALMGLLTLAVYWLLIRRTPVPPPDQGQGT